MNIADGFRWLLGREVSLQTRSEDDPSSLAELLARTSQIRVSPWRPSSTREAMGVPAVFKAISLISNTVGTLSMEAYRAGQKLDAIDTPRLVIRPNPFTRPHVFWRDSSFHMARRGEIWWWTAKRDGDGAALSLLPIDPREITVEQNPRNFLRPIIRWRGVEMPNDDMTQITYLPDPNDPLRGWGPLQACGAAVSVAVEAQEWAANWFAGSPSDTIIKSALDLDETEAGKLKAQWMEGAGNLPHVITPAIEEVKSIGADPEKAQLTQARLHQNGEVALMFSMPSTLLNYAVQGSTITYQNVGQVADDLLRQCLLPHYLEPMEQAMSDLLTRQTIGRFNVTGLLRADIKTRFDVYGIGIDKGIFPPEYAAQQEGILPGDVENRPVPFASPQAIPASLPIQTRSVAEEVRCPACNRKIMESATPPYSFTCTNPKCKQHVEVAGVSVMPLDPVETRIAALELETREGFRSIQSTVMQIGQREPAPTTVTIDEGAVKVDIHVDAPPPAQVTVESPQITVEAPPAPQVTIQEGAIQVHPSPVTVEAAPAPNVTISEGAVHAPVTIHEAERGITVTGPDNADLMAAVDQLRAQIAQPRRRNAIRDAQGRLVGIEDVSVN